MRALVLAGVLLLSVTAAEAQQCASLGERAGFGELNIAEVKRGQARVPFLTPDCQAGKPGACQSKAFVVPGDIVLVGEVFDASACAAFVNAKGQVTTGLLPNDRLQRPSATQPAGAGAFTGRFARTEADITIKPKGRDGTLAFAGQATYGALDPSRVARGAVNLGEFNFDLKPTSNRVEVSLGGAAPVAWDKGKDDDCAVALLVLGPYLAVEDNRRCGGNNVSFTGIYRRQR